MPSFEASCLSAVHGGFGLEPVVLEDNRDCQPVSIVKRQKKQRINSDVYIFPVVMNAGGKRCDDWL